MRREKASPSGWLCRAQSCLLALLTASSALGQITLASGLEIQVATSSTFQASPAVAADAAGHLYVVVWQKQVANGWDVYARQYTAGSGGALTAGPELQVNTLTSGCQLLPAVAADGAGNFVVAWQSAGGIFLRRFTPSGAPFDTTDQPVNTTGSGIQANPAIASDPSGNYVVAWESRDADSLTSRTLARRFQGVMPLNNMADLTVDATLGASEQHEPALATDAIGDWVVAWDSVGDDGSGAAVVAQEFDNRQLAKGSKVVLDNTLTAGDQTSPAVALSQGGSLLAAWQSLTPAADGAVIEARAGALVAGSLYTLTPCRLLDTRNANGPLGGPVLASGAVRVFPVVAQSGCGIPTTAKAISVNVTAVSATGGGFITVYPGDAPLPGTSTVSFTLSRPIVACATHITLSRDGVGTVAAYASVAGSPGQVHLIIDVNGYYQ